ncbi:hypothetical protein SLEP1_g56544 [Rubroshorea leprosula]|uniref:Uncharacterized protein n=1 Tax=Rubroshorea leprosula TaxID=152421 RepID=A0AAV5MK04_9ROSI|nr:hypothetical protein SLEP1_g56544 [Rubroshorea leprosula]
MELYAPNQFCRQLGYCQDIPFLPLFSFNHSYPLWFVIGEPDTLTSTLAKITQILQTMILPDPSFQPNCTSSYKTWWQGYFQPQFLGVLDNISALVPPPLTKKSEEKSVAEESGDLESALTIHPKKPNLPRSTSRIPTKRKITISADSSEEYTPSKQQRTGGIKRSAVKLAAAKKLIEFAFPLESTSATETQI